MNEAIHYHILKTINDNPEVSQRELARKAGISLGKVNYCLRALVDKGCIKVMNFKNAENKVNYLYKLTPSGLEEKARVTVQFLRRKVEEYDRLPLEIAELKAEVRKIGGIEGFKD
ncbi:EPS-associated transcriptional regulator, MarR family [Desulfonatronum thiosulfatophilum]|uniref:EPS-associated transcriptional regulator, MarR family n=1 Tax=Desulfonatronum thiosulfatophilum TaxID=617002 RepID=A0A1G6EC65_9BACT|nr:MarR family EPS-associated transcriptional regulator [Desulfonatronum thiosulfatophilum]SDB55024.1 EPS-associated transcriptional regulator, MarR family [Desulfonatronum thiosulfatophilum]